jgi:hypothetical protein
MQATEQLTDFAAQILVCHARVLDHGHTAHRQLLSMAGAALQAGKLLSQQKALLRHGQWMAWCRQRLPGMSERTVRLYMQLWAEFRRVYPDRQHVADLPSELPGLRQLYVQFGMLRSPDPREAATPGVESFLEPVFRLLESPKVRGMLDSGAESYDEQQREMLREKLRPIVAFYERL